MWGLMVCGVEVRVWTGIIMGWVVITDAPVSDRDTGNGICMIPCGMVTMGPAGLMMLGIGATCMSIPFCTQREDSAVNTTSTPDVPTYPGIPGMSLVGTD